MAKPVVLHLGEPIKYNHDYHDNDFLARFDVVQNDAPDRASFIEALKEKRLVLLLAVTSLTLQLRRLRRNLPPTLSIRRRDGPVG